MDVRHPNDIFGVDELALLNDDTSSGNGRLEAVDVEFLKVDILFFNPMRKQQLHISSRDAFYGSKVTKIIREQANTNITFVKDSIVVG